MADIELVIKIPEEYYKAIMKIPVEQSTADMLIIKNGIQLPIGHGDLKDADKLKHIFIKWSMAVQGYFTDSDIASIVCNSPTVIEADKT